MFGVYDIVDAIDMYLRSDIKKSLNWEKDDFIHTLAALDRWCGKRRLEKHAGYDYTDFSG